MRTCSGARGCGELNRHSLKRLLGAPADTPSEVRLIWASGSAQTDHPSDISRGTKMESEINAKKLIKIGMEESAVDISTTADDMGSVAHTEGLDQLVCNTIDSLPPPMDDEFVTPRSAIPEDTVELSPCPSPPQGDARKNLQEEYDSDMETENIRPKRKVRLFTDEETDEEEAGLRVQRKKRTPRGSFIDLTCDSLSTADNKKGKKTIVEQMRKTPNDLGALRDLSSSRLRVNTIGWVNDIDIIRKGSKNLKGPLSGMISERLVSIGEAVKILAERDEDKGDPVTLRKRNLELAAEVAGYKREVVRLRSDMEKMQQVIESLQATIVKEQTQKRTFTTEQVNKGTSPMRDLEMRLEKTRNSEYSTEFPPLCPSANNKVRFSDPNCPESTLDKIDNYRILDPLASGSDTHIEPPKPQRVRKTKALPRIISHIQVAPPNTTEPRAKRINSEDTADMSAGESLGWVSPKTKRRRKQPRRKRGNQMDPPITQERSELIEGSARISQPRSRRRAPTTSAVVIRGRTEGFSYADAIRTAKQKISLQELGIEKSRIRTSANGGWIIEIAGPDNRKKAENLQTRLTEVIGEAATITRPVVQGEFRLIGFDGSVRREDILSELSRLGNCNNDELKMGEIRPMRIGLFMTWVRCPLAVAIRISKTPKIRIGWTVARVELLKAKPTQCYRCWDFGHVRGRCKSLVDRSGNCFRCGEQGHQVSSCPNPTDCLPCRLLGLDSRHRMGGYPCGASSKVEERQLSTSTNSGAI